MRQVIVGVSAALVLLVACGDSEGDQDAGDGDRESTTSTGEGGGDGDGEGGGGGEPVDAGADQYVEAMATSMSGEQGATFDQEQATCMATAIVDLVGVEALNEAGVTPDDLANAESLAALDVEPPDGAAEDLGAAFDDCGIGEPLASTMVAGATAEAGDQLSEEVATCIEDNMDARRLTDALARSFLDATDDDFQTAMGDAFAACPGALKALILAQAPGEVTPEAEACIDSVIEENREMVEQAVAYNDEAASQELALLLQDTCPDVIGGAG